MSRHSKQAFKTVGDLIQGLQKIDQSLTVVEPWDGIPGWFEVVTVESRDNPTGEFKVVDAYVTLGVYLDSVYADIFDKDQEGLAIGDEYGGATLPEGYDRDDWPYGD